MSDKDNRQLNTTALASLIPDGNAALSAEDLLSFLVANGNIDIGNVKNDMKKARRKQLLDYHRSRHEIFQGKDKRWRTYVDDETRPAKRRMLVKTDEEDLLQAICDHYETLMGTLSTAPVTMASLFDEWLEFKALHVAPTTVERTKRDWQRYYEGEPIVNKALTKLTSIELDRWIHQMIRRYDMNKHQYINFRGILNQMMDYALRSKLITSDPAKDVTVNMQRVLRPEHKKEDMTQIYTREEEQGFFALAWKDFHERKHPVHQLTPLAAMFMFLTGVRVGEVCGLRYSDVKGRTLTVRRLIRYPGNEVVEHTKGTYGDREVLLIPEALEIIEAARKRQQEEGVSDSGFIFSMRDTPVLYTSVTKAFTQYCKELGIDPKSSHKARKTWASTMLDNDVNLNTVRKMLGHKDERTTLNNYYYDRRSDEETYEKMREALL